MCFQPTYYFSLSCATVMPPKKVQVEESIPFLGRFKTQLKVGVVGLPNVGKSTFFNILTKSQVAAENYPFCTIDPNESRVAVPDDRFDYLVEKFQPKNNVPAFLQVMDIAGLVQGASNGEGLGNSFLSHISGCDAIFHMIRAFDNVEIAHVDGDVNPIRDMKIIMDELRLKDIEYITSRLEQMQKTVIRANDKSRIYEVETLQKCQTILENGKWVKTEKNWSSKEIDALNIHMLLTAKPVIYVINIGDHDYKTKKNKWLAKIKAYVDANDPGSMIIPFSATFEQKYFDGTLEDSEKSIGSAFPKLIKAGFTQLQLEYFFTAGKDEVKAWTIRKGTKAPQAAGKIHTDFEKGFIMAEVMKFDDLKEMGSEAAVKNAGKYKQEGKQYVVHDGDIIFFKFNAGAGLSKKK